MERRGLQVAKMTRATASQPWRCSCGPTRAGAGDHDDIHAAEACDAAADAGGKILVAGHVDAARRVRGGRGLAHRDQVQPLTGAAQEPGQDKEEEGGGATARGQINQHVIENRILPTTGMSDSTGMPAEKARLDVAHGHEAAHGGVHDFTEEIWKPVPKMVSARPVTF